MKSNRSIFAYFTVFLSVMILNGVSFAGELSPSLVSVRGKKLYVVKPSVVNTRALPYIIRGVVWSPATRAPRVGPNPRRPRQIVDYGFFFDYENVNPDGHEVMKYWLRSESARYYVEDIKLMKEMNVNTVRVFTDFGDRETSVKVLDEFYRNGIMVIMSVGLTKGDIDSGEFLETVRKCMDHPAILMWALGNEWNLSSKRYAGYANLAEAVRYTNKASAAIKTTDKNHPVSSCIGDSFSFGEKSNVSEWIISACPGIDVWGVNVYRGKSFGDFFEKWNEKFKKPVYISEFGIDSFMTEKFKRAEGRVAVKCVGKEDLPMQAEYLSDLWREIRNNLSAISPDNVCLGGLAFSFNDQLWKVGSYHLGLGGAIEYSSTQKRDSFAKYDPEGFIMDGAFPDNVANEEYFGLVDADRRPKPAYFELKKCFGRL